jgi:hypothetical protein
MKLFMKKGIYKPRFFGYYILHGLVQIADGILSIFAIPFGYECDLSMIFASWNLKEDFKRMKHDQLI